MHRQDYRSRFAHIREVFLKPVELLVSHLAIVSTEIGSTAVVGTLDIIQNDIVHLADVERIIVRCDKVHILFNSIEIADRIHVVVVVADGVIYGKILQSAGIIEILAELVCI